MLRFLFRRPVLAVGLLAAFWWAWPGAPDAPEPRVQAAVIAGGFVAIDGAHRIAEFSDDGTPQRELAARSIGADARIGGLGGGIGAVWRDGKQIAAALLDDDGAPKRVQRFGKRVHALCAGVASTEQRFAVAWTEADGKLWWVHGQTDAARALEVAELDAAADAGASRKLDRCWITGSKSRIALAYIDGSKLMALLCDPKRCAGPRRVRDLPKQSAVLGIGCANTSCVVATRDGNGIAAATWFDWPDKTVRTMPLPHAAPDTAVELVGTGAQVALAYATSNEPVVVTLDRAGALRTIWQGASDVVPSLAWSSGTLLVARIVDGKLAAAAVRTP